MRGFCVFRLHSGLLIEWQRSLSRWDDRHARLGQRLDCSLVLTAYAGWESAKAAMQLGAVDYFEKGREPEVLNEKALRRENEHLRPQVQERYGLPGIIARSEKMQQVLDLVARVAPTDATVLIQGESGTGKEVIAKALHNASGRKSGPFVAVNCGALPEGLLESEIFGHVKGAFTGAATAKRGLMEEAHGGTLFLDEIGEMPPSLQVKPSGPCKAARYGRWDPRMPAPWTCGSWRPAIVISSR